MSVSRRHLAEVLGEKTLHIKNHKLLAREIAAYLLHENRTADFMSLMRDIIQYRAEHGVVEATAASAHELSAHVKTQIKDILHQDYPKAKHITLHNKVEPKLLGGVRVDLPNEQLDLTLRTKLAKFKNLVAGGVK